MAYTKVDWTELVPISAANLDQMDSGIKSSADLVDAMRPVRARVTGTGTRGSTSYGSTLTGSDAGPAVTVTVGASGIVLVHFAVRGSVDVEAAWASVAVSGASTVAASDTWAILVNASVGSVRFGSTAIFTGLAAGSTTFTLQYRNSTSPVVSTWLYREIIAVPQP
jgi:hypothetical protein